VTAALRILNPGMASTLQDCGRFGYQRFGVPVSGALDPVSLKIANMLAGNEPCTPGVEILGSGLQVQVEADSVAIALAGTAAPFRLEGGNATVRVSPFHGITVERGDILRFAAPSGGAVCYLAVEGGFDIPSVLGSRATYRRAGFGGFHGRALDAGDRLPLRPAGAGQKPPVTLDVTIKAPEVLRVMRGPNADYFAEEAFGTLFRHAYTVSPSSDRMGLRLLGPSLDRVVDGEIPSQGTTAGGMQVPSDGQPIMLMADRQTTGGYPRIATVIGADIAAAGRLSAGMKVRFEEVTRETAIRLLNEQERWLASLPSLIRTAPANALSVDRLLSQNLIGGVTAGGGTDSY
jgi:5-oxoprolinase (ATP-hydrolysing) subunit C